MCGWRSNLTRFGERFQPPFCRVSPRCPVLQDLLCAYVRVCLFSVLCASLLKFCARCHVLKSNTLPRSNEWVQVHLKRHDKSNEGNGRFLWCSLDTSSNVQRHYCCSVSSASFQIVVKSERTAMIPLAQFPPNYIVRYVCKPRFVATVTFLMFQETRLFFGLSSLAE